MTKQFKSILPCPYGCYMNERATPSMNNHMNYKLYGSRVLRFIERHGVKKRMNNHLMIKWKNRFRYYNKTLC